MHTTHTRGALARGLGVQLRRVLSPGATAHHLVTLARGSAKLPRAKREAAARPLDRTIDLRIYIGKCIDKIGECMRWGDLVRRPFGVKS